MSNGSSKRFLVVSFDGLRPDLISSATTPNILRLQRMGTTLSWHRTIYPSETRAAFPSFVTGATADRHGMVGNRFVDRSTIPNRLINTADAILLDKFNRESGGRLMTAETLGEILGRSGKSLAVLSSNSAGTTRLFHHNAEAYGHVRISGNFVEACTPNAVLSEITSRYGSLPAVQPDGEPNLEVQETLTSAFLEIAWPRYSPDISIISFGEPDITSHYNGVGGTRTLEALRFCDRQLGRLIDWWEGEGQANNVQLAVISDHGHVTGHSRVSVQAELQRAGYRPGAAPGPDIDVVVVPGQVGALYLPESTSAQINRLVGFLVRQPWCGSIFTAPRNEVEGIAPGTLSSKLIMSDHDRSPDVYFCFRADDSVDQFGLVGGTFFDHSRGTGLGVHGGLHPKELSAVGILAGSDFLGAGHISKIPSGICDLAPTFLKLLGISLPTSITGRVLSEVLIGNSQHPHLHVSQPEVLVAETMGYSQVLKRMSVGSSVYLEGGWVGPSLSSITSLQ